MKLLTDTLWLSGNLDLARKRAVTHEAIGIQPMEITATCPGLLLTQELYLQTALLTASKIKFSVPVHRTLFKYLNTEDRAYSFKNSM